MGLVITALCRVKSMGLSFEELDEQADGNSREVDSACLRAREVFPEFVPVFPCLAARVAQAAERQLVLLQLETLGNEILEAPRAAVHVEVAITCSAVKVVMVFGRDRGELVAVVPTTDGDVHKFTGFLKTANRAIHGS